MSPQEVYDELLRLGVKLSIQGEMLTFTAPKGTLTPERLGLLKKHKPALIELLKLNAQETLDQTESYLASYGQEALWLLNQTNPHSPSYHTAAAIRLESTVDVQAMQLALDKLIMRHAVLRTTFVQRDLKLYASIQRSPTADFRAIDATAMDEQALHRLIQSEYSIPFDLEKGPLFRTRLFTQDADHHVLLLTLHHIIFDATSLWILQSELQTLYAAETSGTAGLLPALKATYKDFANWQRNLPQSEEGERQWEYWKQELAGDPVPAELPWSFTRPRSGDRNTATYTCPLTEAQGSGLRNLAKRLSATPFVTAMAVFQTLIYRYSGQTDFVVGTTTNGRSQPQSESGIGYYVNVLPLRVSLTPKSKFVDVVKQTKQKMFGAIQAGDFPFPLIVKRLNPVRALNAAPLCRMVFGLQKPHAYEEISQLLDHDCKSITWGGLQASSYKLNQQEGQFDLTLELYENSHSFNSVLKYDRNLLSDTAARRLTDHYLQLLESIIADPQGELDAYDFCNEAERAQILEWSLPTSRSTEMAGDRSSETVEDNVEQNDCKQIWSNSVKLHASSVALSFQNQSWTYEEIDLWSTALANHFVASGVRPGDRIVVSLSRQPIIPVALLASIKCGAAYVPVAPDSPIHRFSQILAECQPRLVIMQRDAAEVTDYCNSNQIFIRKPCTLSAAKLSEGTPPTEQKIDQPFSGDTAAYIIYTSGSTGVPKGVEVSHRAFAKHVHSMASIYEMRATDRVLQFSDCTFDPSLEQLMTPWSVGGSVVMRPEAMFTGDGFWREVRDRQLTVANVPPSFFVECSHFLQETYQLRLMIVGGDVFPVQALANWRKSKVRLINAYGPTEAVITATTQDIDLSNPNFKITIGRPKPGSSAYVLNACGHLSPIGIPGELVLGGPMLAKGYLGDSSKTKLQFPELSIDGRPSERVYRTGDFARWSEDGNLEFLGRTDRQIKIRGFRIEPGEVEAALLRFPGVRDAAVILSKENLHSYLAAYLLVKDGSHVEQDQLLLHLKSILPIYMIPERFAVLESWPMNDAGKISIDHLPLIPRQDSISERNHVAPRTPLEQVIANIWLEVLELESVGVHDEFFQLGGGSLQSLRIVSRLQECGVQSKDPLIELSPQMLFQYVTIAELSSMLVLSSSSGNAIATESSLNGPSLVDVKTTGNDTMSSTR